jgi:hypothetical protein
VSSLKKSQGYVLKKSKPTRRKHIDKRFSKVPSSDEARKRFRLKELEELKKRKKKDRVGAFIDATIEYGSEGSGSRIRKKK